MWWKDGAPRREYAIPPAFTLQPGQWGRVEYNLRRSLTDGGWEYQRTVLNIGCLVAPATARFFDSAPDYRIVTLARLW
jgi:hypothetical protein